MSTWTQVPPFTHGSPWHISDTRTAYLGEWLGNRGTHIWPESENAEMQITGTQNYLICMSVQSSHCHSYTWTLGHQEYRCRHLHMGRHDTHLVYRNIFIVGQNQECLDIRDRKKNLKSITDSIVKIKNVSELRGPSHILSLFMSFVIQISTFVEIVIPNECRSHGTQQ